MAYAVSHTPGSDTNCAECGKPLPQRDTKDPVITKVNTGGMVSEYLHMTQECASNIPPAPCWIPHERDDPTYTWWLKQREKLREWGLL